jgi:hypothetical protein
MGIEAISKSPLAAKFRVGAIKPNLKKLLILLLRITAFPPP